MVSLIVIIMGCFVYEIAVAGPSPPSAKHMSTSLTTGESTSIPSPAASRCLRVSSVSKRSTTPARAMHGFVAEARRAGRQALLLEHSGIAFGRRAEH